MKHKLFIIRPQMGQGGAERVTLTLLQLLDRKQFDLSLVLIRRDGPYIEDIPDDVKIYELGARNLWTSWLSLARLLRKERPDILFSPGGTNVPSIIAKKLARVKTRVVISERNVLEHGELTAKRRFMIYLQRLFYPLADHLTAVSQGVKNDLVETLKLLPERIQVLYNPIVDEHLLKLSEEKVSHPWFEEDIPIILGVGRLVPQKNFQMLIRAFAQTRQHSHIRLVILGEGQQEGELLALAKELSISQDVWFAGFDKNPFKFMAKADVFVLSSLHEGLPGVLIQAMACGAAVISTDCPYGPNEIITSGQDGYLVPINDVEALRERIIYLLSNNDVRREFSKSAEKSAQRFRVEKVLENYCRAIEGNSGK